VGPPITTKVASCLPISIGLRTIRQTTKKYIARNLRPSPPYTGTTHTTIRDLVLFVGLPAAIQRRLETTPRPIDGAIRLLHHHQKVWTLQRSTGGRGPRLVRPSGSLITVPVLCSRHLWLAMPPAVHPEGPMDMAIIRQ
jgi:hypothetical protein